VEHFENVFMVHVVMNAV